jgi:AcrR family transcriptional regulator
MPRQDLLESVVDHLRRNGLGDASLRSIGTAIDSSHRMLVYHFGSRAGLLAAVVGEVERQERERSAAVAADDATDALETIWGTLSDPTRANEERLFFELAALALRNEPGTEQLRRDLVEPWLDVGERLATELGVDPTLARTVTRLDTAVVRGLLLDLLATDDRDGVQAAFDAYAAWRNAAASDVTAKQH